MTRTIVETTEVTETIEVVTAAGSVSITETTKEETRRQVTYAESTHRAALWSQMTQGQRKRLKH